MSTTVVIHYGEQQVTVPNTGNAGSPGLIEVEGAGDRAVKMWRWRDRAYRTILLADGLSSETATYQVEVFTDRWTMLGKFRVGGVQFEGDAIVTAARLLDGEWTQAATD